MKTDRWAIDASYEDTMGGWRETSEAPSAIITATLEDGLAVEERPKMPTKTTEWANWSIALPAPVETLLCSPLAQDIGETYRRRQPILFQHENQLTLRHAQLLVGDG